MNRSNRYEYKEEKKAKKQCIRLTTIHTYSDSNFNQISCVDDEEKKIPSEYTNTHTYINKCDNRHSNISCTLFFRLWPKNRRVYNWTTSFHSCTNLMYAPYIARVSLISIEKHYIDWFHSICRLCSICCGDICAMYVSYLCNMWQNIERKRCCYKMWLPHRKSNICAECVLRVFGYILLLLFWC